MVNKISVKLYVSELNDELCRLCMLSGNKVPQILYSTTNQQKYKESIF